MNQGDSTVGVFLEMVTLGARKRGRAAACALLGYKGGWKAAGQYPGQGVTKAKLTRGATEMAVGAPRRPMPARGASGSAASQKQGLFDDRPVEWARLPEGAHPRQLAVYWAACEVAPGGVVTGGICEPLMETRGKLKPQSAVVVRPAWG